MEAEARNLGVDHRGAGKSKGAVRMKRMAVLADRGRRLLSLKRAGGQVAKVAKTGLRPSVCYGIRCLGLAPKHGHVSQFAGKSLWKEHHNAPGDAWL